MELLEKILTNDNLNRAYQKVYSKQGAPGVDGITVEELKDYLKAHKDEIITKIKDGTYEPQPVRRVEIPKDNGDTRKLGIPTVVDRVVQQAIVQILSPIYEQIFHKHSYGFRPRRSCEMAIIKALEIMNKGNDWIVDLDLEKFFDKMNRDKLIAIIAKNVKDEDLLLLIQKIISCGVMENGVIKLATKGIPQGGNLSPLLGNIMLNELDIELKATGLQFVRYADDFMVFTNSETEANHVLLSITQWLEEELELKVNTKKSKVSKPAGIKFLGFGFWVVKKGEYKPTVHVNSIEKFKIDLCQLNKNSKGSRKNHNTKQIDDLIKGWVDYFKIANIEEVFKQIENDYEGPIKTIVWKHFDRCQQIQKKSPHKSNL